MTERLFGLNLESHPTFDLENGVFRAAVDSSPAGVALVQSGAYEYANQVFAALLGYEHPGEIVGRQVSVCVHAGTKYIVETLVQKIDRPGSSPTVLASCQGPTQDGSVLSSVQISSQSLAGKGQTHTLLQVNEFLPCCRDEDLPSACESCEAKYRRIFENLQNVYYEVCYDGTILEVSPSVEEVFGYTRSEVIGNSLYEAYSNPAERDFFLEKLVQKGRVSNYEISLEHKHGRQIYANITAKLLYDEQGKPEKIVGCLQDVTLRRQIQDALQEREKILQVIFRASPVGLVMVRKGILKWANPAAYKILGYVEDDSFIGKDTSIFYPDRSEHSRVIRSLALMIEHQGLGKIEARLLTKDAREIHCLLQSSPLYEEDLNKGLIVCILDITELKEAEKQIRLLNRQLIRAQEKERQNISCELHDCIAQDLATLKINCETLVDSRPGLPADIRESLSNQSKVLQKALQAVRDLSYNLRPTNLDHFGLVPALKEYCRHFGQENSIKITFSAVGLDHVSLSPDISINFYRIVQEALNNVKWHAEADRVFIHLVYVFPELILRINDNGCGFDTHNVEHKEHKMGLGSIKARTELLGGSFRINSKLLQGTSLVIEVPFSEEGREAIKTDPDH
ncbi:MAG: PAS domain S-box protein [Desulfohalobiaceae bacterium]|nr:PAS domain S-box protein [Desulfohalobiaceae bacterium]